MGGAAKTPECKHRGSYNISPTSTAGLQTSLLLFILRTIAGQEALGDRVRSFTPTPLPQLPCAGLLRPFVPSRLERVLNACTRKWSSVFRRASSSISVASFTMSSSRISKTPRPSATSYGQVIEVSTITKLKTMRLRPDAKAMHF
jgi:hypothetical protein